MRLAAACWVLLSAAGCASQGAGGADRGTTTSNREEGGLVRPDAIDAAAPLDDASAAPADARTGVDANVASPDVPGTAVASIHVALGVPSDSDPSDDVILDHQVYVVSYNPRRNDPNWVSWHLTAADIGAAPRQDDFRPDDLLPALYYHVAPKDYVGSGYDRGHMCPSADRTLDVAANSLTFLMTNMQPQLHALNAGPWSTLEAFERQLVTAGPKDVYVVAGGIFDPNPPTIGQGIAVPRANYKIIVVVDAGQGLGAVSATTTVYAVIMPNAASITGTKWTQYAVTVDEVERQSGYDFLTAVPVAIQAAIEARSGG